MVLKIQTIRTDLEMLRTFVDSSLHHWIRVGGVVMNGLPAAFLLAGPLPPPMPPIEIEKPVPEQQPGIKVESFRFEIDQKNFDCSAGTLNSGNKAPYAYNPSTNAFAGELQIHAAQCKTRF